MAKAYLNAAMAAPGRTQLRLDEFFKSYWSSLPNSPSTLPSVITLGVLISLSFYLFTDVRKKRFRIPMSLFHASVHVLALIVFEFLILKYFYHVDFDLGIPIDEVDVRDLEKPFSTAHFWGFSAAIFAYGWLMGSLIMGWYLAISLNFFNMHWNEAFSALRIKDWKSFLRMKIDETGTLTIYPVGLPRVPREWEKRNGKSGPLLIASEEIKYQCALIEAPIVLHR
jgi:hypothetical protein